MLKPKQEYNDGVAHPNSVFATCMQMQQQYGWSTSKLVILIAGDEEMAEMAREEVEELGKQLDALEERAKVLLLPKDPLDDKNIMLEASPACIIVCTHSFTQHWVAVKCLEMCYN